MRITLLSALTLLVAMTQAATYSETYTVSSDPYVYAGPGSGYSYGGGGSDNNFDPYDCHKWVYSDKIKECEERA